jgi:hypothetical protein
MVHGTHQKSPTVLPVLTDENLETLIDAFRRDPEALAEVVSRAGPDDVRRDGWSPVARRFARACARTRSHCEHL